MICKHYQFGHTTIEINMPEEMSLPQNMSLFETSSNTVQKSYILEFSDNLIEKEMEFASENPTAKQILRPNMRILQTAEKECRVIYFEGANVPYAISIEESKELTRVWFDASVRPLLMFDTVFVSALGLEKVMIRDDSLIFHSAYMCRNDKAILFSAPSGTGKSTQAGLWEKYRGTRQINGDKSLLIREQEGWYAHGWPICGSSQICHNEKYPIQAIVMLFQAKENTIRKLGPSEAFRKVMSQVTINMWNSEFQMKSMDLIQGLVMEVPIYELGCDISEEAVKCLETVI